MLVTNIFSLQTDIPKNLSFTPLKLINAVRVASEAWDFHSSQHFLKKNRYDHQEPRPIDNYLACLDKKKMEGGATTLRLKKIGVVANKHA